MFNKIILVCLLCLFIFSGCTSVRNGKDYRKMSREKPFSYFFPKAYGYVTFNNLEDAFDYLNTAKEKIYNSLNKSNEKGMNAKLSGSVIPKENKVTVIYLLTADSRDISTETDVLESSLIRATSVSNVYLVFYNGKGISISDFYLEQGYIYNFNSQYENFDLGTFKFKADYQMKWNIEDAFNYLKNESD